MPEPEERAGAEIDAALASAGWAVQDASRANLAAARGVAIREFPLLRGFGFADYLLYVDGQATGVIEAKPVGSTPTGAEPQAERYARGLSREVPAVYRPLPFIYQSTGVETRFTNRFDPEPRSRRVFHFHRPDTVAAWLRAEPRLPTDDHPSTLRQRVQIRTVVQAFKDRLFTEIFPGRTEVPKTLVFAKDDSHADDIVQVVREVFAKVNESTQKITYRTWMTGQKPEDPLASFRNSYFPRIAVTVDMVATGTDIRPLEIVVFMRAVRSRIFFEQMKGRGVRVVSPTDLQSVTPDASAKDRFVIVDCVGVCEQPLSETYPLERQRTVSFARLLQTVAFGNTAPDVLSSLAGRLARLDAAWGPPSARPSPPWPGGQRSGRSRPGSERELTPSVQRRHAVGWPASQ